MRAAPTMAREAMTSVRVLPSMTNLPCSILPRPKLIAPRLSWGVAGSKPPGATRESGLPLSVVAGERREAPPPGEGEAPPEARPAGFGRFLGGLRHILEG